MRTQVIVLTLFVSAVIAYGQTAPAICAKIGENGWVPIHIPEECYLAETFNLASTTSSAGLQGIVQVLKSGVDYANVSADASAYTLTVRGSPEKLAMTGWLLRELDRGNKSGK